MASIIISVIVSLVIGIGIGAFGIEMLNRLHKGRNSRDPDVDDVHSDLNKLEKEVRKVSDLVQLDENIYETVSDNRNLAESIYGTVSKKQSAVDTAVFLRQTAPSRVTEAEQFTVPKMQKPATYQPLHAAKPEDWCEETPSVNMQQETVRVQPQSHYTQPVYEQPAYESQQAAEEEQDHSSVSMEQIFDFVEKMRGRSPKYRLYNPNTGRLEFTPDATADYIVVNGKEKKCLYVLPNQISRFHKKHLEEALYRCNVNYIGEECKLKQYCKADETGNILSVGTITD